jgi:2,5-diketo-D-gluconate reductase A
MALPGPEMPRPEQNAVPLRPEGAIPLVGFGTWRLSGRSCYDAVLHALATGYRHIDTATMYENESEVGRAMRDSGLDRQEVFLTTKLLQTDADKAAEALGASLRRLGTDYVDLWLIHWPPGGRASPPTWARVLHERELGRARAAGVSNYSTSQVDELITATGEAPAVNQVRWGPSLYDPGFVTESAERGVVLEGYSPLRATPLGDTRLVDVAQKHGVSAAQVVLRWHIEHRVVVIPRSQDRKRIEENFALWDWSLAPDEVALIDGLSPTGA